MKIINQKSNRNILFFIFSQWKKGGGKKHQSQNKLYIYKLKKIPKNTNSI